MKKTYFIIITAFISIFFLSACGSNNMIENNNLSEDINLQTSSINNNQKSDEVIKPNPANFENLYSIGYNQAIIKTNLGEITLVLFGDESLETVNNFLNLAKLGFYNNTKFHRVIPDFMIQAGDPNTKTNNVNTYGTGGPGYRFPDEINERPLVSGSLAMANSGPNTNGSQFFIVTTASTPWLDGLHTNFGQVTEGMEVVKAIESVNTNNRDLPLEDIIIYSVDILKAN
jgi:cyclophilin family peptidyl-prolyl cis-trans isomerase